MVRRKKKKGDVWRNGEDSTGEEIDKRKMNTERERGEMEVKVKESTRRSNGGINYFEQVNIYVGRELRHRQSPVHIATVIYFRICMQALMTNRSTRHHRSVTK